MRSMASRLPSPALAVACVALALALGGGAYAAEKAAKGTVVSASIKDGAVGAAEIADGAVGAADVAAGAVGSAAIADGAVGAAEVAPNAVGAEALREGAVTSGALAGIVVVSWTSNPVSDADGISNGGNFTEVAGTVQCPPGTVLLSGGSRWVEASSPAAVQGSTYIKAQRRSGGSGNDWTVYGIVDFGAVGTIKLRVEAYCLSDGSPVS